MATSAISSYRFGRVRMIGLVIVTHGRLATEFVSAMEHVVGPQRGVAAICIGPEDDMERRRQRHRRRRRARSTRARASSC